MEPTVEKPHLFLPATKDEWDVVRDMYYDVENLSQISSSRRNCGNQDREIELLQPTIMRW